MIKIKRKIFLFIILFFIFLILFSCYKEKNESASYEDYNLKLQSINTEVKNNDRIIWDEYDKILNLNPSNNKFFILFFYADWCPYCKKMEETTFKDKSVIEILNNNFIAIKINSESRELLSKKNKEINGIYLSQKYQITGLPTTVFLDKKGNPLTAAPGYLPADFFINILKYIYTESYKTETFESFIEKQK
ncbi:MAG: thioredoxin family protein [Exilispira sp.]